MRRLALTVAALASVAAGAGQATAAPPSPTAFVLAGGGWGHGVGMSQWGAFGQAKAGRDYRSILAHYYPGTTLGPSSVAVPARSLPAASRPPFYAASLAFGRRFCAIVEW